MGKGDIKTRRGKLFAGSYGVTRPRNKKKGMPSAPKPEKALKDQNIAKEEVAEKKEAKETDRFEKK